MVARSDMERLVTEVMQMKEFLPKVSFGSIRLYDYMIIVHLHHYITGTR